MVVRAALEAKTQEDALGVQELIAMSFGGEYLRPLGDRWNNFGLLASAADYDIKLVELVTNMQDAVIERAALEKFGTRAEAAANLPTPQEAARVLFGSQNVETLPEVTFHESDPPATQSHKLTAWFDDRGTGMTNHSVPSSIFALGGSTKEDAPYLQGAFGLGGELMYRNSAFVVLVTRRAPALLEEGEEDRITVAVVQWDERTKTQSAVYLVDREWNKPGDIALPWSCSASEYPSFDPGTHIALISYGTAGFHRKREGDERSFDTIVNTRLFRPVLHTRWRNYLARGESRATTLVGLRTRIENTSYDFPTENDLMPFVYRGKQVFLNVTYVVFADRGQQGERRNFVAHDHAVLFTSNGQVQSHWTPSQFKQKTKLKKLDSRVLVEVNLDELPVEARTALVTPDRAETVKSEIARKLDEAVASFLNEWDSLVERNQEILREQLRATSEVNTRGVSDQIRRAFAARGFGGGGAGQGGGTGGQGNSGGTSKKRKKPKPIDLLDDPTYIKGPESLQLETGRARGQKFEVNATDEFFEHGRGELQVEAHGAFPFTEVSDIVAVGRPHLGRVRLSFAIPDGFEGSEFELKLVLRGWSKKSGGIGQELSHTFRVSLVAEIAGSGSGTGRKPTGSPGNTGGRGANAVLLWVKGEERGWQPTHVGELERMSASDVAAMRAEYDDLSGMGDTEIDCITLNADYPPLIKYIETRAEAVTVTTTETLKNRFAVGVGVQMLVLQEEEERLQKTGIAMEDPTRFASYRAAARGVLAILPEFDRLAQITEEE